MPSLHRMPALCLPLTAHVRVFSNRHSCPICSTEIGVEMDIANEDDPDVLRELTWLAELRRRHPGMNFW